MAKGTPLKEALLKQSWSCYPHEAPKSPTQMWNRLKVPFGLCVDWASGETIIRLFGTRLKHASFQRGKDNI